MSKAVDEIARDLGVSITTVRLVMSGKATQYRISEATQQRVNAYIDKHGYILNQAARSLSLRRSETLGLIVPNLTNPFFSQLTEQFEVAVRRFGYQLLVGCSHDEVGLEEELIANLLARGVDGLFVTPSSRERQAALVADTTDKPLVFLDRDFGVPGARTVTSDNFAGSYEMVGEILQQVADPLFYLGGDTMLPTVRARLRGFEEAHLRHGRALNPHWLFEAERNRADYGFELMKQLHETVGDVPSGLVFSSLPILEGALHFIHEHRHGIPSDLVVGTFDDHTMLDFLPNCVFSVKQNPQAIVGKACRIMQALLTGGEAGDGVDCQPTPPVVLRRHLRH